MKKQKNRENGCLSALCNQFFVPFSVILPSTVFMACFNFKSNETIGIVAVVLSIVVWAITFDLEIILTPYIAGMICWAISLIATLFFSCTLNHKIFAIITFIIWGLMGLVYYFTIVRDYY